MAKKRAMRSRESIMWDRRRRVMELIRQGLTTREVADMLAIGSRTVYEDERAVRLSNIACAIAADEEIQHRAIDRYLGIYRKAMEGFEMSKKDEVRYEETTSETKDGTFVTKRITRVGQCGDPRFLSEARQSHAEICQLQGLTGKDKLQGTEGGVPQLVRVVIANGQPGRQQLDQIEALTFRQLQDMQIIEGKAQEPTHHNGHSNGNGHAEQ